MHLPIICSVLLCSGVLYLVPVVVKAGPTPQSVALGNNLERWNFPTRSQGVGGAYTADAAGFQGALTNPASLSRLMSYQFSVEHQTWREDWNLFQAGIALPMRGGHAVSLNATWLDFGELEPAGPDEVFRPQANEIKAAISYSYRFTGSSSLGISGGMMGSEIGFREREFEPFVDLGFLHRITPNLWFGINSTNVVGDLEIDTGPDKLPMQFRTGLAWNWWEDRLTFTGDLIYHDPETSSSVEDDSIGGAGGIRIQFFDHFRISSGYHNFYDGLDGITAGIQIEFPNFRGKASFLDTGNDELIRVGGNMRF